jgi:Phosphotransferase enzyme family
MPFVSAILRAANAALGVELTDPADLGGSGRSVVLRCAAATGGSVIVKAYTDHPEAPDAFAAEVSGLSLGMAGPELLAVDAGFPLLVMEDLGEGPTLADALLGDDPGVAAQGLREWAGVLGRLAAGSVHRRDDLSLLRARYGAEPARPWLATNLGMLPAALAEAGLSAPPGLAGELTRVAAAAEEEFPAFSPGDTCPDNCLLTPEGPRLIDFEAAGFQSVFLTAAYCRMPFATCWCVGRMPASLAEEIEEIFRGEVAEAYPALADDAVWHAGMDRAIAAWTAAATARGLPRLVKDELRRPPSRPMPTRRELARHRWTMASTVEGLPAFAATMRLLLHEVAGAWDAGPLPAYPAFTGA